MNKKVFVIIGMAVVIILVGAGGFWGGTVFKANQASQVQDDFITQRGGFPGGGQIPNGGEFPEGTPFPNGDPGDLGFTQGFTRGGGTLGQVKSIDGYILTLSTAQDVSTINLSDTTTIIKSVEGSTSDLQPGTRVMVVGETDENGNINASQITIVSGDTLDGPIGSVP